MSFEGYYRGLCESGHLITWDIFSDECLCPFCGNRIIWRELVDETNGEGIETELKVKEPPVECICRTCGCKHISKETIYHIPK